MKRMTLIFTVTLFMVSCNTNADYPGRIDLNNHLVAYYAWDYSTNTKTQLIQ